MSKQKYIQIGICIAFILAAGYYYLSFHPASLNESDKKSKGCGLDFDFAGLVIAELKPEIRSAVARDINSREFLVAITDSTKFCDTHGNKVDFSYLKRGAALGVKGESRPADVGGSAVVMTSEITVITDLSKARIVNGSVFANYVNPHLKVSLWYPAWWSSGDRFDYYNNLPTQYIDRVWVSDYNYEVKGGFFEVYPEGSWGSDTLNGLIQLIVTGQDRPYLEDEENPYAENSTVIKTTIQKQEAAFIFPNPELKSSPENTAVLVVSYPEPLEEKFGCVKGTGGWESAECFPTDEIYTQYYKFLVLRADRNHIRDIAETIVFLP